MKKYVVLLSCSLILTTVLLFMNCTTNEGQGNSNPGQGSDFGFTPGSPTSDNSGSDYGFDPANPARGGYYSTSSRTGGSSSDPFHKSDYVLDLEEKFGTSAPITTTSKAVFEDFRLSEPVNRMDDIEDLRVYVKLSKTSNNYYAGDVTIAYWDNGRPKPERKITFKSGSGNNAKYNVWFRKNSEDYFHGFAQEDHGSTVLVIDSETPVVRNPDDPTTNILYSGSIWVMQFRTTFNRKNSCNNHAQQYVFDYNRSGRDHIEPLSGRDKKCWFFTSGPFDCRTWRKGKGVDTFKAVNPDDRCYSQLGTFQGLNILKAFDVSVIDDIQVHR